LAYVGQDPTSVKRKVADPTKSDDETLRLTPLGDEASLLWGIDPVSIVLLKIECA
jgi:hypothetical protein